MVCADTGKVSNARKVAMVLRVIVIIPLNGFSLPELTPRAANRGQKKGGKKIPPFSQRGVPDQQE
jgi:hypothetical protein